MAPDDAAAMEGAASADRTDSSGEPSTPLQASSNARPSKIIDLRNLLAERFPRSSQPSRNHLKTGIAALDEAIHGGLAKNCITELTSPHVSAGSASLVHSLLGAAQRDRYFLALVDGRDSFDPATANDSRLRHLLWIRCGHALHAVKATDLLLRDGNFPLVILDLVLNSPQELRKIPQTNWYRLQRLVELIPAACLVLTRHSIVSSAQWKLILDNSWGLEDLETSDAVSRLKIEVRRVHGAHQIAGGS